MSSPCGWSPPSNGQPPAYVAPPAQGFQTPNPGPYYAPPGPTYYAAPEGPYYTAPQNAYNPAPDAAYYATAQAAYSPAPQVPYYAVPEASHYAAPVAPYDNGYDAYRSALEQRPPRPTSNDPFAGLPRESNPFMSLSARGARQKVTMVEALILWLRNWNNFTGRASRSEYWWIRVVQLVGQALWWVLFVLVMQMHTLTPTDNVMNLAVTISLIATSVVALVLWIPNLSLTVRRLHDTDHSGWYFLMGYVPFGSWMLLRALYGDSVSSGYRFDDHTKRPYGVEDID